MTDLASYIFVSYIHYVISDFCDVFRLPAFSNLLDLQLTKLY